MQKKIFVLTGEPSGDKLASKVIAQLKISRSDIEYLSVGGEHLKSLGIKSLYDLKEVTYLGFTRVLLNIFKIKKKINETVHKIIELCLSNEPENGDLAEKYGELPARLFSQMVPALDKINMIRALETGLYSKRLGIAGTVDCVAEYEGKLSIIDFKTARRKWDEMNENYLVQATFYSIAWEERTKEKVDQIAILTTTETGELYVHKDDPSKYIGRLDEMVAEYNS